MDMILTISKAWVGSSVNFHVKATALRRPKVPLCHVEKDGG